jgi:hypothetical protein
VALAVVRGDRTIADWQVSSGFSNQMPRDGSGDHG